MPTQVSLITEQTDWVYVEVDQRADFEDLLRAAKEFAIRENKKVMFATNGQLFQVTSESDLELMAIRCYDRYNCSMFIDGIRR